MKILFVLEYYLPHMGGLENVFSHLAEGLVKKGHEVTIVTSRIKGTSKKEIINGVVVKRVRVFGSRYLFAIFSIPKCIIEAFKSDIVQTTTFAASVPGWIASLFTFKKVVLTVHEVWLNIWDKVTDKSKGFNFFHNLIEKMIYVLPFTKYVCVSDSTKKELLKQGINSQKVLTIHNGMDYEHWNPKKYDGGKVRKKLGLDGKFIYLGYGRPGASKGFNYLIRAAFIIKAKIPNSKLVLLLGRDETYSKQYYELMDLIAKLDIKEHVLVLDSVKYNELPNYIKMADCVVVPSLSEGFGYTCVEACTMGVPVVASNTTSLPEVINGKGVLVKVGDPEDIARGVILVSKGKFNKFPKKTFLWEDNINSYEKLYEDLICTK